MEYQLTERALKNIQRDVNLGRVLEGNSDAFRRGPEDDDDVLAFPNIQWLRVSSTVANGNYYPAVVQFNYNGFSFQDLDANQVWIIFPRGYVPTGFDVSNRTPFFSRQDTDYQGMPAFAALNCPCN